MHNSLSIPMTRLGMPPLVKDLLDNEEDRAEAHEASLKSARTLGRLLGRLLCPIGLA